MDKIAKSLFIIYIKTKPQRLKTTSKRVFRTDVFEF